MRKSMLSRGPTARTQEDVCKTHLKRLAEGFLGPQQTAVAAVDPQERQALALESQRKPRCIACQGSPGTGSLPHTENHLGTHVPQKKARHISKQQVGRLPVTACHMYDCCALMGWCMLSSAAGALDMLTSCLTQSESLQEGCLRRGGSHHQTACLPPTLVEPLHPEPSPG